jgi:hypothetical protein
MRLTATSSAVSERQRGPKPHNQRCPLVPYAIAPTKKIPIPRLIGQKFRR